MRKTVTVVAAFAARPQLDLSTFHFRCVAEAAKWAGEWLEKNPSAEGPLGFTVTPSFGGGAGWDVEAGLTFVFGGVPAHRVLEVASFARALKEREKQEAVIVLVRDEGFSLV